ncbi:MAG: hypothetical protein JOZ18_06925 [Chloroflexi bacterium]|nr:hypothetical protein [Chloroflexota bacterium]
MEIVYERCCGLDIHKKRIVACLITPGVKKEIRTYRTVTNELLALHDWLYEAGCTHIAMEATGVYWNFEFESFMWESQQCASSFQAL